MVFSSPHMCRASGLPTSVIMCEAVNQLRTDPQKSKRNWMLEEAPRFHVV